MKKNDLEIMSTVCKLLSQFCIKGSLDAKTARDKKMYGRHAKEFDNFSKLFEKLAKKK